MIIHCSAMDERESESESGSRDVEGNIKKLLRGFPHFLDLFALPADTLHGISDLYRRTSSTHDTLPRQRDLI